MAKPIPPIKPLKGKDAERMIKYLREHQPDPEWVKRRLEEDRKLLRGFDMKVPFISTFRPLVSIMPYKR